MVSYLKNISERIFHDTEEEEKKIRLDYLQIKIWIDIFNSQYGMNQKHFTFYLSYLKCPKI